MPLEANPLLVCPRSNGRKRRKGSGAYPRLSRASIDAAYASGRTLGGEGSKLIGSGRGRRPAAPVKAPWFELSPELARTHYPRGVYRRHARPARALDPFVPLEAYPLLVCPRSDGRKRRKGSGAYPRLSRASIDAAYASGRTLGGEGSKLIGSGRGRRPAAPVKAPWFELSPELARTHYPRGVYRRHARPTRALDPFVPLEANPLLICPRSDGRKMAPRPQALVRAELGGPSTPWTPRGASFCRPGRQRLSSRPRLTPSRRPPFPSSSLIGGPAQPFRRRQSLHFPEGHALRSQFLPPK